jgi:hypothetical protein
VNRVAAEECATPARCQAGAPRILIASTGERSGLVIAVTPPESPYVSGARLTVGDVHRISFDEDPEKWRAWLWPEAGGVMHVTRACEAVDASDLGRLGDRLQKRADKDGPWWGGEVA